MAATYGDLQQGASDLHRAFDGEQMPYRTPRGPVFGRRTGLYVAAALAVGLAVFLFLCIAYMAHWQWVVMPVHS